MDGVLPLVVAAIAAGAILLIFFGLVSVGSLGGGSMTNAFISLFFGLLIATVGVDDIYGAERFVFGVPLFKDGIHYLVVFTLLSLLHRVTRVGLSDIFLQAGQTCLQSS